jgi:manganese oxidase
MSTKAGWRADVIPATGQRYRDFALFLQDHDDVIGTAVMAYTEEVRGTVAVNYRAAPLNQRRTTARPRVSLGHLDSRPSRATS